MSHRLPVLLAVGAGLAACTPSAPNTQVEQDWLDTVRRFSLNGIYPPTEDLQPGDVLLDVPPVQGVDAQPRAVRLGSLKHDVLLGEMSKQAGDRLLLDGEVAKPTSPATDTSSLPPAKPPVKSVSASHGRIPPHASLPGPPLDASPHVLDADAP